MIERIKSVTLEELVQRAERDRAEVMNTYTRGQAALELAEMALEHGGSGSESAAHLLSSYGIQPAFQLSGFTVIR